MKFNAIFLLLSTFILYGCSSNNNYESYTSNYTKEKEDSIPTTIISPEEMICKASVFSGNFRLQGGIPVKVKNYGSHFEIKIKDKGFLLSVANSNFPKRNPIISPQLKKDRFSSQDYYGDLLDVRYWSHGTGLFVLTYKQNGQYRSFSSSCL